MEKKSKPKPKKEEKKPPVLKGKNITQEMYGSSQHEASIAALVEILNTGSRAAREAAAERLREIEQSRALAKEAKNRSEEAGQAAANAVEKKKT